MTIHALINAPADDWYIRIEALPAPKVYGHVTAYQVTVYEPGHKASHHRLFTNPHHANEWADSWGLPRSLTEHV